MSDQIKHECGIAFMRLRKPMEYYYEKYGTPLYGLKKMQILLTKQLNRGQDGAGIGVIKLDPQPGNRYIARKRSKEKSALSDIFTDINNKFNSYNTNQQNDINWLKINYPYAGELILGHLRYGTHGNQSTENIHPFLRQSNWMSRNLLLAGNYNMTNVHEMYNTLISLGQHPKEVSDNVTMLEKIGHFLDEENNRQYIKFREQGFGKAEVSHKIKEHLDLETVLKRSFKEVDGAYNMIGLIGDGNGFIMRDPNEIRPSYYYADDEVIVATSEKTPIQTAFNISDKQIKAIPGGSALILKRDGSYSIKEILPKKEVKSCSFERIYFSRGNDREIYKERKLLGKHLAKEILKGINYDLKNSVFTYIPNTASTAFYGFIDGINQYLDKERAKLIMAEKDTLTEERIKEILSFKIRREKVLVKDVKMRTFITNDNDRDDMVANVYDLTYGVLKENKDNIVAIDDSIVRGTTLRTSIIRILSRLKPKKVIVASSAPPIKYPDCYGIDMSKMKDLVAFRAAVNLLKKTNQMYIIDEAYNLAKEDLAKNQNSSINAVKIIYDCFSDDELIAEITNIVKPDDLNIEVQLIYNTILNLHKSSPKHTGDWYFSGDYPTPGGYKVVNRALVYYVEGKNIRSY